MQKCPLPYFCPAQPALSAARGLGFEQTVVLAPDDSVTFACRLLQSFAIPNPDSSAPGLDQLRSFQFIQDLRDPRTPHAQQPGKELVRYLKLIAIDAVVRQEKPASGLALSR